MDLQTLRLLCCLQKVEYGTVLQQWVLRAEHLGDMVHVAGTAPSAPQADQETAGEPFCDGYNERDVPEFVAVPTFRKTVATAAPCAG